MKYCTKCGTQMQDDMRFCPKCGTESMVASNTIQDDLKKKVDEIKSYNLVLPYLTYSYVIENTERAGNIYVKQANLSKDMSELVKDTLNQLSGDMKDIYEREIYNYVLTTCCRILEEITKMYRDTSVVSDRCEELKRLAGTQLNRNQILAVLEKIGQDDMEYMKISNIPYACVQTLLKSLDSDVIRNNQEYRLLTFNIAKQYNEMVTAYVDRAYNTHGKMSPGILENIYWKEYEHILRCLTYGDINKLDESGWYVRNAIECSEYIARTKRKYDEIREIVKQRDEKEKKEKDDLYWSNHPEEFKKFQVIEQVITDENKVLHEIQKKSDENTRSIDTLKDKIGVSIRQISDSNNAIRKLESKIFGKKKAEEKIISLKESIRSYEEEIDEYKAQIKKHENELDDIRHRYESIRKHIDDLFQEQRKLRNE